jgi:RNA ligase
MLKTMYDISRFDKDLAYSVEIIYPENRIVVDYGDAVKLVFLAAFYKDGTEAFPDVTGSGMPVVETYDYTDYNTIKGLNWTNCEGFVVRFISSGKRIKIKFDNYVRLHGLETSLSNITVWKKWSTGMPIAEAIEGVPDELFEWFTGLWNGFDEAKADIMTQLEATYKELYSTCASRKEFAKAVLGSGSGSKLLFALYEGKSISSSVVDMVKPTVRKSAYAYEYE